MKRSDILLIAGVALVAFVSFFVGKRVAMSHFPNITERVDTLVLWDTLTVDKPVPRDSIIYKTVTEYLPVHDTTFLVDSVLVDVPIERKTYQEDSVYYAVVSGFRPSLDTLEVYRKTVIIEKTRNIVSYKPYKWAVSPFISQEVGTAHYMAKVGVAADLGFKNDRFRFGPEVGYQWTAINQGGWYAGARIKFDLFRGR